MSSVYRLLVTAIGPPSPSGPFLNTRSSAVRVPRRHHSVKAVDMPDSRKRGRVAFVPDTTFPNKQSAVPAAKARRGDAAEGTEFDGGSGQSSSEGAGYRCKTSQVLSEQLSLPEAGVRAAIGLLRSGGTVPFIARYRKESTGSLDETQLRAVADSLETFEALEARRKTITETLRSQGVFTGKLRSEVLAARTSQRLEDLYLPFRPKRSTRSSVAKERGLAPLAAALIHPTSGKPPAALAQSYLSKDVNTVDDALAGARDILAEQAAELPAVREAARQNVRTQCRVVCKQSAAAKKAAKGGSTAPKKGGGSSGKGGGGGNKFEQYHAFTCSVSQLQPHQVLAINRGEDVGALSVALEWRVEKLGSLAVRELLSDVGAAAGGGGGGEHQLPMSYADEVRAAVADGLKRLLKPSMERELRADLTAKAQAHAVKVFGKNLYSLLLQPPMQGKVVLGVDPAYRTGCKLAVVDATGRILETGTVYPHPPASAASRGSARGETVDLVTRHAVDVVAIGNGTASRETEQFIAKVCEELPKSKGGRKVGWVVVDEAGASVYSASQLAVKELPNMNVSLRGAVSIARRLQDPLSELVKIEPQHIGVGLYQHDVKEKTLSHELDGVVESAVNRVGVDVNVASAALLARVAGLGPALAKKLVDHRDENGPFRDRASFLKVKGLGARTFEQCAGFLRVRSATSALENTPIHPESYPAVRLLLTSCLGKTNSHASKGTAVTEAELAAARPKLPDNASGVKELASKLSVGEPTLADIIEALKEPGRDVRGAPKEAALRTGALSIEQVVAGMQLSGTVRNVVAFGAFVDVGIGRDALLHKSGMKGRGGGQQTVTDPHSVASVGDVLALRVVSVDLDRGRINMVME